MVEAALARGWGNERIARTVGISPASLKRHFRAELAARDAATDRLDLAMFSTTARKAIEGDMGAMRGSCGRCATRTSSAAMRRRHAEIQASGKGKPTGKKAAAQAAAAEAPAVDSGWGDLLDFGLGVDAPDRMN